MNTQGSLLQTAADRGQTIRHRAPMPTPGHPLGPRALGTKWLQGLGAPRYSRQDTCGQLQPFCCTDPRQKEGRVSTDHSLWEEHQPTQQNPHSGLGALRQSWSTTGTCWDQPAAWMSNSPQQRNIPRFQFPWGQGDGKGRKGSSRHGTRGSW